MLKRLKGRYSFSNECLFFSLYFASYNNELSLFIFYYLLHFIQNNFDSYLILSLVLLLVERFHVKN